MLYVYEERDKLFIKKLTKTLDIIDFCHATRTEIDMDMYVYDSTED